MDHLNWKVAGRAGEGIDVTGVLFGKLCMRHGMQVFSYREYPSLIRGGHNTHQVHASFDPVSCQRRKLDVLIALNEEGISLHQDELDSNTVVFCEASQDGYDLQKYAGSGAKMFDVPMTNMSRQATGHFLAQNVVALACTAWVLGLSRDILAQVVKDQFGGKGEETINKNLEALRLGYEYAQANLPQIKATAEVHQTPQIMVTGNHAVALGAISAGVQYFAAYPMTPTSDVLHTLAAHQHQFPLVVKHVEDEIAAINHVIGASYAGVRAMTASATGGYALMVEATALAAVAETPLVICVGQRPGPATGLPTWTCQSDLEFILHAGHGEIPRVVLTPGSVAEHFELTRLAFELAEKHHVVAFVLSDKFALESYATMPAPTQDFANPRTSFATQYPDGELPADDSYRRFADTQNGMSPRSIPGQAHGLNVTNSYEHDEFGYATEDSGLTKKMNERRAAKTEALRGEVPKPVLVGPESAPLTLVSWGSTRLVLDEVLRQAPAGSLNLIHIPCAAPFPAIDFSQLAQKTQKLVMIEANLTGQMERVIRQETGITMAGRIRRYDGRPFYAEDLLAELKQNYGVPS